MLIFESISLLADQQLGILASKVCEALTGHLDLLCCIASPVDFDPMGPHARTSELARCVQGDRAR
jgi:hypothetical protein